MSIIDFHSATKNTKDRTRHLLLGNGFSIACVPGIFTYNSIFKEADFTIAPEVKGVFTNAGTEDFEKVVNALDATILTLPVYEPTLYKTIERIQLHSSLTKEILLKTLAKRHPSIPSDISDAKYKSCRSFLSNFISGKSGKVYTLNYDLLLYWAILKKFDDEEFELNFDDGFGKDSSGSGDEYWVSKYVTWQGETKSDLQRIYYLHGALHLFDKGKNLEKFTWVNTGKSLLNQAKEALEESKFPLFVSEGSSDKKLDKIAHSAYLHHNYKSFSRILTTKNSCLFTFGFSFSENDEHIIEKITKGHISDLYVGLYGDASSDENQMIINRCERLQRERFDKYPINVTYYNSESAQVWDNFN